MKSKKITAALAMLLVSAVLLSTASYAWFAMNTRVNASGLTVGAYSDSIFLQIAQENTDAKYGVNTVFEEANVANLRLTTPSYFSKNAIKFVTLSNLRPASGAFVYGTTYYEQVKSGTNGKYDYKIADVSAYTATASSVAGLYNKNSFVLKVAHGEPESGYTYYSYSNVTDKFTLATPTDVYGYYALADTYTGELAGAEYNGSSVYYQLSDNVFTNVTYTLRTADVLPADRYYIISTSTGGNVTAIDSATVSDGNVEYYIQNTVGTKSEYSYLGTVPAGTVLGDYLFWGRAYSDQLNIVQEEKALTIIPDGQHGYYYLTKTLYIRQAPGTVDTTNLEVSKVTITGATNPLAPAIRVLFVATSSSGEISTAIYDAGLNKITHDNATQDDNGNLFDKLLGDKKEVITVQIYIYFDGTDEASYTNNIVGGNLNGQNIEIEFSVDNHNYN